MTSPLSKEQAMSLSNSLCLSNATTHRLVSNMATELVAIGTGHHVVISAPELSALRAREERLRELVKELVLSHDASDSEDIYGAVRFNRAVNSLREYILNEGKT